MNDRQAIARLKRGDLRGLEILAERYQVTAIRVAYAIVREPMLAEDIVQAALVSLPQRIGQFDAGRAFAPWFMRVVANDAITSMRREARTMPLEDEGSNGLDALADDAPQPEEMLAQADTREQLWSLLDTLTPEQRAVIVLRYYADFKHIEIAERLDIPPGTVRWRLHAALRQLRRLLRVEPGSRSDAPLNGR